MGLGLSWYALQLDKIHQGEKGAKEADEAAAAGEEGGEAVDDDETKIKDDEEAGACVHACV